MKFYAYYLPQFHCIPENDLWWGKGFTEWVNVKKAKQLYKGHLQPKRPLNDNYYSLDDIETLKWQSELMKEYKIDGLILYHYYFTGKKLLEKPIEMLLESKDIDINFFFCWANHTWYRSWEGSKKILIKQEYGTEKEWEEHFNYLLQFFKDKRYQKKDNKPIIMIFDSDIKEKKEMFKFFNKKCIENGFDGICLIEKIESYDKKQINYFWENERTECTEYVHLREPGSITIEYFNRLINFPMKLINKVKQILGINNFKVLRKYNGDNFFKLMIKKDKFSKNIIRGLFFEWDNTPRHSYRGYVITPPKKETFMNYLDSIKNDEFVFVNAWNEWAEGMIMEPTIENKYKYLEWIKEWKDYNENRINGI